MFRFVQNIHFNLLVKLICEISLWNICSDTKSLSSYLQYHENYEEDLQLMNFVVLNSRASAKPANILVDIFCPEDFTYLTEMFVVQKHDTAWLMARSRNYKCQCVICVFCVFCVDDNQNKFQNQNHGTVRGSCPDPVSCFVSSSIASFFQTCFHVWGCQVWIKVYHNIIRMV